MAWPAMARESRTRARKLQTGTPPGGRRLRPCPAGRRRPWPAPAPRGGRRCARTGRAPTTIRRRWAAGSGRHDTPAARPWRTIQRAKTAAAPYWAATVVAPRRPGPCPPRRRGRSRPRGWPGWPGRAMRSGAVVSWQAAQVADSGQADQDGGRAEGRDAQVGERLRAHRRARAHEIDGRRRPEPAGQGQGGAEPRPATGPGRRDGRRRRAGRPPRPGPPPPVVP